MDVMAGDLPTLLTTLFFAGMLVLVMRWVFTPSRPVSQRVRRLQDAAGSDQLGLLEVVSSALPRAQALRTRAALGEAGIRSSQSIRQDGRFDVLVFRGDMHRAHEILHNA